MTLWFLATGLTIGLLGICLGSSVCLISKEVCAKIVSVLLPQYVKFPTGSALSVVVGTNSGFHNASEQWMVVTYRLCPMFALPIIITERVGILLFYRERWIFEDCLSICMLVGLVVYTTPESFQTQVCAVRDKVRPTNQ